MNKCEVCNKESEKLFCIYNQFCPELSYKVCRDCFDNERIPYYGVIGLLALPEDWGIILDEEYKKSLFDQAEKYYHKTHSEVVSDLSKANKVIKEINGEEK